MDIKQQRYAIYRKLLENKRLTPQEQDVLNNSFYWVNQAKQHTQH